MRRVLAVALLGLLPALALAACGPVSTDRPDTADAPYRHLMSPTTQTGGGGGSGGM